MGEEFIGPEDVQAVEATDMQILTWICGITLGIAFLLLAGSNALGVARYIRQRRHVSAIPLFGGIAGLVACFVLPVEGLGSFWWLPLVVDYGSVPLLISFVVSRIMATARGDGGE